MPYTIQYYRFKYLDNDIMYHRSKEHDGHCTYIVSKNKLTIDEYIDIVYNIETISLAGYATIEEAIIALGGSDVGYIKCTSYDALLDKYVCTVDYDVHEIIDRTKRFDYVRMYICSKSYSSDGTTVGVDNNKLYWKRI